MKTDVECGYVVAFSPKDGARYCPRLAEGGPFCPEHQEELEIEVPEPLAKPAGEV